jgi:hypothetical protein
MVLSLARVPPEVVEPPLDIDPPVDVEPPAAEPEPDWAIAAPASERMAAAVRSICDFWVKIDLP